MTIQNDFSNACLTLNLSHLHRIGTPFIYCPSNKIPELFQAAREYFEANIDLCNDPKYLNQARQTLERLDISYIKHINYPKVSDQNSQSLVFDLHDKTLQSASTSTSTSSPSATNNEKITPINSLIQKINKLEKLIFGLQSNSKIILNCHDGQIAIDISILMKYESFRELLTNEKSAAGTINLSEIPLGKIELSELLSVDQPTLQDLIWISWIADYFGLKNLRDKSFKSIDQMIIRNPAIGAEGGIYLFEKLLKHKNDANGIKFKSFLNNPPPRLFTILFDSTSIGDSSAEQQQKQYNILKVASDAGFAIAKTELAEFYYFKNAIIPPSSDNEKTAFTLYSEAGDKDPRGLALTRLAECHLKGYGVENNDANKTLGLSYLDRAAEMGCPQALRLLGDSYKNGWYGFKICPEKAFEYFKRAAKLTGRQAFVFNSRSWFEVGECLINGNGVEMDEVLGVWYCYQSASCYYPEAAYSFAKYSEKGTGIERNNELPPLFYLRASSRGYAEASYTLSYHCLTKIESFEYMRLAAERGLPKAQYSLGKFYQEGQGIEKSPELAMSWMKKASSQGNQDAKFWLGSYYADVGNYEEAAKWLTEINHFNKENFLGYKNNIDFIKCALKVEKQVPSPALQHCIGAWLEAWGMGRKDSLKAVEYYSKSAAAGYNPARNNLAYCYENGTFERYGITKNLKEALRLYKESADAGNHFGKENYERLLQQIPQQQSSSTSC